MVVPPSLALLVVRFRRGRRRRLGAFEAQVFLDPFGHAAGALLSRAGGCWGAPSATDAAAGGICSDAPCRVQGLGAAAWSRGVSAQQHERAEPERRSKQSGSTGGS